MCVTPDKYAWGNVAKERSTLLQANLRSFFALAELSPLRMLPRVTEKPFEREFPEEYGRGFEEGVKGDVNSSEDDIVASGVASKAGLDFDDVLHY